MFTGKTIGGECPDRGSECLNQADYFSGGSSGRQTTAKTATNGLGAVVGGGGNSLATQAAQRAMNVNNPNK